MSTISTLTKKNEVNILVIMYFIKKKKPKIEHIVLYNSNNFNTYIQRLIDGTKYLNQKKRIASARSIKKHTL